MKRLLAFFALFLAFGCQPWNSKQAVTKTWAETTGKGLPTGIGMQHDPSVAAGPEVQQDKKEEALPVPPGSTVTVEETAATETAPATVKTTITLPQTKGMNISKLDVKTKMNGSKGFEPAKAATPTQKATAAWTYVGIGICALGIFFCTPWGGSNYRAGALIAAGGIGMSIIGKFIDQINIPAPAIGLIFVLFALAMYYGYRIRHKQAQTEPPKPQ